MNFQESLRYLYNLGYELSVKKFGLENTIRLLAALNNPEKNYLKIQIAGTNGKGSTCAFLDSICVRAGIKTGLYTSPHLISVTERIKVEGAEISEKDFARHATKVREISKKLVKKGELKSVPTFFEQVTAIALNYFAEQEIELAILETGLGGRFDSTTATNAEIVAITPIDLDHQDILGETLAEIASEKAAVIREGARVVVSEQREEAMKVILRECETRDVVPRFSGDYETRLWAVNGKNGKMVAVFFGEEIYNDIELGLPGRHQLANARVAIALAEILREDFNFSISSEHVEDGMQEASHAGRLEFRKNFLFDGAHNAAGANALREYLDEAVKQPIVMIFGSMKDKDFAEIGTILFPKADRLILTTPDNPRSMKAEELIKFLPENFPRDNVFVTENVAEALKIAREISSNEDLILVTGSLYLIGEAQKNLDAENYV